MVLSFPVFSFGNRNILYQEVVPISMINTFIDKKNTMDKKNEESF